MTVQRWYGVGMDERCAPSITMDKTTLRSFAGAAALALAIALPLPAAAESSPTPTPFPRTIRVTGEGLVTAQPDVAVVSIGVEAFAPSASAATADATRRMRAALDALSKEGIPPRDIRTSRYDVAVERSWHDGKPGPVSGYRVSNSAEVRVRDLARLGAILEAVTNAGSNVIGALQLDREDRSPEQLRALALAYASARAKGDALAKAAGVELGPVVSVQEGSSAGPPRPLQRAAVMQMQPREVPIAGGDLSFTAQVEVVFAVK